MTAKTRLAVLVADYKDAVNAGDLDLQLEIKLAAYDLDRANPDSPRAMDAIRFVDRGSKTPAAQAA
ncbi:hypothetical protein [Streptomyces sp. WM6349]|uniref:hypothetical protein n=1 Tax=Streptomyces sp. WM6349 TaxID=1415552 RepID=UPI0006AFD1FF|nr:hypothetical protein [Streptomyces sp. WM6349]KOU17037.1 hypothetical protein ADK49_17000 [Streptomyces sp. WM6349]